MLSEIPSPQFKRRDSPFRNQIERDDSKKNEIQVFPKANKQKPETHLHNDAGICASEHTTKIVAKQGTSIASDFVNFYDKQAVNKSAIGSALKCYHPHVRDMLTYDFIDTESKVVTLKMTEDSQVIIALCKESSQQMNIQFYRIIENMMAPRKPFKKYTISGRSISAKDIDQHLSEQVFCVPYLDMGQFWLFVFDEQKEISRINLNSIIDIDESTRPIYGLPNPMINAVFINKSTQIFVNLLHRKSMLHHHFIYDYDRRKIRGQPEIIQISGSKENFPVDSFFDEKRNLVHCFYRQGQDIFVSPSNVAGYECDTILKEDFGQMFIYNSPKCTVLITRSSEKIIFFEAVGNSWQEYHRLDMSGFIFGSADQKAFFITSERFIYCYKLQEDESSNQLVPKLELTLYNFMGCSQMMMKKACRNSCLTYKYGSIGFTIINRKFKHTMLAQMSFKSYQNSVTLNLAKQNKYCVTEGNKLYVYDQLQWRNIFVHQTIQLPFHEAMFLKDEEEQTPLTILHIQPSEDEKMLAVLVGEDRVWDLEVSAYFLYFINAKGKKWKVFHECTVPSSLRNVCKQFMFSTKNRSELLFTTAKRIVRYNYSENRILTLIKFDNAFDRQPLFFALRPCQNVAMVSSFSDVLLVDVINRKEVDIDELTLVQDIRQIAVGRERFFILANKRNNLLGKFLVSLDPENFDDLKVKVLVSRPTKLDIGDAQIFLIQPDQPLSGLSEDQNIDLLGQQKSQHTNYNAKVSQVQKINLLIFSYKTVYVNNFQLEIINLETGTIMFRYVCKHLWESNINCIPLNNYDVLILSNLGKFVLSFGNDRVRTMIGEKSTQQRVYSLSSFTDLKVEQNNSILYSNYPKRMAVEVQHHYRQPHDDTTVFQDIYQIKIFVMKLREALLCQSLMACRHREDIVSLINRQETTSAFFKSFLELEKNNLFGLLAFDTRIVKKLLGNDCHSSWKNIDTRDAVIFKTKAVSPTLDDSQSNTNEPQLISAIDIALKYNQIGAVNAIIDYIIAHQNNHAYFYLFRDNFVQMIKLGGIHIGKLLDSNLFYSQVDFDSWPLVSDVEDEINAPYNGSMYNIRDSYSQVWKDYPDIADDNEQERTGEEVYQITYMLNTLPGVLQIGEEDNDLMCVLGDIDEEQMDIFEHQAVQDLLEYKWNSHCGIVHYYGAFSFLALIAIYSAYIIETYVYQNQEKSSALIIPMLFLMIYPVAYDFTQLYVVGAIGYISDPWNWFDQAYIFLGIGNLLQHMFMDTHEMSSILTSILVCYIILFKTFAFLRIFSWFNELITMLGQVTKDMGGFVTVYMIVIWILSLVFNAMGMTNLPLFDENGEPADSSYKKAKHSTFPGVEYRFLPIWIAQFCAVLRLSLGDFDFSESSLLDPFENIIYWITWLFIVCLTNIVFLNFVIAEVSASYQKVKDMLEQLFLRERAKLIKESEDMLPGFYKSRNGATFFPKYLIKRTLHK